MTIVAASICCNPARAESQDRWSLAVAAGPADVGEGVVGHAGVRVTRAGLGWWEAFRADLTAGRRRGYRLGAATVALELGPPAIHTGGVRLFALLGGSVMWTDDAMGPGAMAGVGMRAPIGRIWITAEQRFQPAFSPLLIGVSF